MSNQRGYRREIHFHLSLFECTEMKQIDEVVKYSLSISDVERFNTVFKRVPKNRKISLLKTNYCSLIIVEIK